MINGEGNCLVDNEDYYYAPKIARVCFVALKPGLVSVITKGKVQDFIQ